MAREFLLYLRPEAGMSIQSQLRGLLISAILDGQIAPGEPLPSSRKLARQLGVARNTVALTYQALVDESFLIARERSGYYVNGAILSGRAQAVPKGPETAAEREPWARRLKQRPSRHRNIRKPSGWQSYRYPFIYGQFDPALFPLAAWRECSRQALARTAVEQWASDSFGEDDPMLVDEVRCHVLPRRGVRVRPDEVLITLGAQNALYILAALLVDRRTTVGVEDPGYVDARNIFRLWTEWLRPLPVDELGLVVDERLDGCDCVYLTPSHQAPTTAILPLERRLELLERAARRRFIVIEDDYEAEINYVGQATTALKALDAEDRVVYAGSFSKVLAPGLRLGYMAGPSALIAEARALQRLLLRHPPANNQRTLALFLAGGHYDALLHRLHRIYRERWTALGNALAKHLPEVTPVPSSGGTSFWLRGPVGLDAEELAGRALERGVILEPGAVHFLSDPPPRNYFRLGFSSIPVERIDAGVELLAELVRGQIPRRAQDEGLIPSLTKGETRAPSQGSSGRSSAPRSSARPSRRRDSLSG